MNYRNLGAVERTYFNQGKSVFGGQPDTHTLHLNKVNGLFVESKNQSFLNMLKIKVNGLA